MIAKKTLLDISPLDLNYMVLVLYHCFKLSSEEGRNVALTSLPHHSIERTQF